MNNNYSVDLPVGKLDIAVSKARLPLSTLLTFGARENPKRNYLFISKVLGKYVPCRPSVMRNSYKELAGELIKYCTVNEKLWVLGVAETATALGAGVAQEANREGYTEVIYSHTTRYNLPHQIDFSIEEAHSHAPSHLIYDLNAQIDKSDIQTVVIVDDEITTGKTLNQLSIAIKKNLPKLKKIIWMSLVSWLSPQERSDFEQIHPDITLQFCSLLDGCFNFEAIQGINPRLPEKTICGIADIDCRADNGRRGYELTDTSINTEFATHDGDLLCIDNMDRKKAYTVIGTGEFLHQPFLFAEMMEEQGFDVVVQSTGRSPILPGVGIQRKESFFDVSHQGDFYLYNRPVERHPIILYETWAQYNNCSLKDRFQATTGILT